MRRRLLSALAALFVVAGCTSGPHAGPVQSGASASAANAPDTFDVRAENAKPGTNAWAIPSTDQATDPQLAAWVNHDSIRPGDKLTMYVTTNAATVIATAYRMGWYGGKFGRQIWQSQPLPGKQQPKPLLKPGNEVDASNWTPTTTIQTTGWPEGLYLFKLTANGKSRWIPLTVRSANTRGRLVLVNPTPTYQAYNAYGGYSLYTGPHGFGDRATTVSFNRPYDRSGARLVTAGERQVTALAEKLGLATAYVTSLDIERDPTILNGATGVVSLSHDEYWTNTMRTAYLKARDSGSNLAFFGANAEYWRIRIGDNGRTVTTYKSATADPIQNSPNTTAMWRSAPDPRPENDLTGLLYECFPARGAMVVTEPNFFLFKGTGATAGSRYNGLVGVEIDRAYPLPGTPPTLEVAAHSPVACGTLGITYSDLAYYTVPSGAGVFASGSMGFAVGILGTNGPANIDKPASAFATQVSANLLTAMAAGPMGKAHPATPNLARLGASASTRTGTGGPIG